MGGSRSATINVRGEGVWSELCFEAGVHSVKRVPATEAAGRIHTFRALSGALRCSTARCYLGSLALNER